MCGISGFVGIQEHGLLQRMTDALRHRGPDGEGFFCADGVGLGHRRLSIIDVAGGRQPIENEDGSLVLIHNGEIYNHRELRQDLQSRGHRFRTASDSEVILHLYEEFGTEGLQKMAGMWTFALYDRTKRRLMLARDRLGIKPLYYVEAGGGVLFASEIKSLLQFGGFEPTLDLRAVHDYLALRYVPGPGGLFHEVRKLPAAHYAIVEDGRMTLTRYWSPVAVGHSARRSDDDYIDEFAERFERSITRRLMSEVPLGAYLSAGLDSSTIVAAMARLTSQPVRTFTVGFDFEHDELEQAAATARHLGCVHTEIPCRAADVELLPEIVWHLDEPIGDPIVIPMFQLARRAKQDVTVVLTGEGADETLAGYLFHKALLGGAYLSHLPGSVRRGIVAPLVKATPASVLNLAFQYPAALGNRGKQKLLDYLPLVGGAHLPEAYRHLISLFDDRDTEWLYSDDFKAALRRRPAGVTGSSNGSGAAGSHPNGPQPMLDRILALQYDSWLPEDILTKQDKMSMAHGIEARVPFLDHELVEFTLGLPPSLKLRRGISKFILRRYASRLLPPATVRRRKMPFYVPAERYLAEPAFQALVADTLSERAVKARGLLKPEAVTRVRNSMQTGEFLFVKQAISLMMLELWFRMAVDRRGAA
jgi:asparagine synthase (glutamine-hydrolysing)